MNKLPCCISCAKSEILCYSCQERLEEGDLTDLDLDVAEILLEKEEEDPETRLTEASFYKSIDLGNLIILIIGKGEKDIFKRYFRDLQKELNLPRIELIEKAKGSVDLKSIIHDFVQPGKLLGINKLFLPTGEIEYKAKVQIRHRDRLPMSKKTLENLLKELTEKIVRIDIQSIG
mgnify:FL=1